MKQHMDQTDIRLHNTMKLLDILLQKRPISRADIAKISKMSPTSVTRIITDLLDLGFIQETELSTGGVGRKAVMLDIVPSGLYTVGIHIEKHELRLCIMDFSFNIVETVTHEYDCIDRSEADIARICLELFYRIVRTHNINLEHIIGVGIGVVGVVDPGSGAVLLSPQLGWHDVELKACFEKVFGFPCVVDNDVKMALIGNKNLLDIPGEADTAILQLGSGVGSAATSQSSIVRGKQNAAGEIGHIIIDRKNGIPCECGRRGCLQTHIATGYLLEKARQHDSSIQSIHQLHQAYDQNKAWALDIMDDCLEHIAYALEIVNDMYNPSQTIVTGSLTREFQSLMPEAVERFESSVLVPQISKNRVIIPNTDRQVCVLGCAYTARDAFLSDYMLKCLLNNRRNNHLEE